MELSPGESWLGLKKIHELTTEGDYSLYITLKDFDNKTFQAVYAHFEVIWERIKMQSRIWAANYLKMSINRMIGFVVKILESDVKAVISLSGELVDFFQAEPQFTW